MTEAPAAARERFRPAALYVERGAEAYPQCQELLERYSKLPLHWIDQHHKIEELREAPDSEFLRMKRYLVIGIRKTMKISGNNKSADFIVPWTSSGCTASCSYCYLVANWFKGAYLRVFVNRIRFSINPPELVRRVEIGTSPLLQRLAAANRIYHAGYRVGLNLAPIMLVDGWEEQYDGLLTLLGEHLDPDLLRSTFFELIFMTYGWANDRINQEAMPGVLNVFEREKMRPKGPTKMHYKLPLREEAAAWFRAEIASRFPDAKISYVV